MLGIKFPAVEVFQQANTNALYLAAGILIALIGLAVIVPIVKISLVVVGAALIAYSAMQLYKNFFPSYGDTDISKK